MKDRTINYTLQDMTGHKIQFSSYRSLKSFIKDEWLKWDSIQNKVGVKHNSNQTVTISGILKTLFDILDSWSNQLSSLDDPELSRNLSSLNNKGVNILSGHWLWSGHPFTDKFIDCIIEKNLETALSFLNYVLRRNVNTSGNNLNTLEGALLGYEFVNQKSEITKRRKSEKASLRNLRDSFLTSKDTLFSEVDDLKETFESWGSVQKDEFERLYQVNKYLGERKVKYQDRVFQESLRSWSSNISELENTYEEKLRLQKPAEYWNEAAKRYGLHGGLWTIGIVISVVVGLVYFHDFFTTWLEGHQTEIKLNTLQGVILFGSIGAVYAYLLRVLSRLTFSSYHLMRDAQEREQLTYLYLSLSKDNPEVQESRELILQALFCRSETGLLGQEHGPTMPGVGDAIKAVAKVGK